MPERAARSSTWSACARLSSAVRADSRAFSAADLGTLDGLTVEIVIGDVRGHGRRDLALHALAGAEPPAHAARRDGDRARLDERAVAGRQRLRRVRWHAAPVRPAEAREHGPRCRALRLERAARPIADAKRRE